MKQIEFNGYTFTVEDWAKFVTMDDYGDVYVWEYPPRKQGNVYVPVFLPNPGRKGYGGYIKQSSYYESI